MPALVVAGATAALLALTTAGCADDTGYPGSQVHAGAEGVAGVDGVDGSAADHVPRSAVGHAPRDACPALPAITNFVERNGAALTVQGARFRALGANLYYLQQLFSYAQQSHDDALAAPAQEALDALVCLAMPVARVAAFNDTADRSGIHPAPGVFSEAGLLGLDQAVFEAKRRGIRVVLILTNGLANYGGIPALAAWEHQGPQAFFTDPAVRRHWEDHARRLTGRVNHLTGVAYKDEPAIVAWELGNELRCPGCRPGQLNATVRELAQFLRPLVPRQLISDGGEGFDDQPALYPGLSNSYAVSGDEGASYSALVEIPEIDLASYHLYPEKWGLGNGRDVEIWIDVHEALARAAGKVAYLGEFGWSPASPPPLAFPRSSADDQARAEITDRWLDRLFRHQGGAVGVLWQIIPPARDTARTNDGFGVVVPDDDASAGVLAGWAGWLK